MARLYTDEDIAPEFVNLLRAESHDVLTARDNQTLFLTDDAQLLVATDSERILVTHNGGDYALLFHAWRNWSRRWSVRPTPEHAAVISVPQNQIMPFDQSASLITSLVDAHPDLWNQVWIWSYRAQTWNHYPR